MQSRYKFQIIIILAIVALCLFARTRFLDISSFSVSNVACTTTSESEKKEVGKRLRKVGENLLELQKDIDVSSQQSFSLASQLNEINDILELFKQDTIAMPKAVETNSKELNRAAKKQEVCPEKFMGKDLGYGAPYYRLGYARVKCDEFVPINALITFLMYVPHEYPKPAMSYLEMMKTIANDYPDVRIILATEKALSPEIIKNISTLKISLKNEVIAGNKGTMLAKLLEQVETPYVLIAPYISHFDDDIDLYRLVRVLSYRDDVAVAGGSYRNLTGHWRLGCQQISFKYWTAKYTAGYYKSFNECVVCDHLPGPFAAKTEVLKLLKFDPSLSEGVFHDLFWRLKRLKTHGNLAVVCADVMFNMNTPVIPDEALVKFAAKHDIKKMSNTDGTVRWYGCRRGLSYTKSTTCSWPNGIGAPPCDLWNLGEVVKFVMQACEEGNMHCEYAAGNVLGAVKFASVIPWEKDADIHFHTKNFTAFNKLRPKFEKAGFGFSSNSHGLGGFSIKTKRWRLSMYGRKSLEVGDMISQGKVPTRVPMSGAWVTVPRNPGMFARNHYVTNYFRHVEHHGGDSFYSAGAFKKCPIPGHSACLEQFSADGNIQFLDYVP